MFLIFIFFLLFSDISHAAQKIEIDFEGAPQKILYDYYVPPVSNDQKLAVLVCVGGLPIIDGEYAHSDPTECRTQEWETFAQKNNLMILGLGFLFDPLQWENNSSYQYPKAWSGKALLEILDLLDEQNPIKKDELYLWGVSAGAQFSVRFAQMRPDLVKAVTAHAAGGYDEPTEYIATKILLTVGKLDNQDIERLDMARIFTQFARRKKIDVTLKIIPNIAHQQTEPQNKMSRDFIEKTHRQLNARSRYNR